MDDAQRYRKFALSLELQREIARALDTDPVRVRALGLAGAKSVRLNARNLSARARIDERVRLLDARDWNEVRHHLTRVDGISSEMRHMTVFLGVIDQDRRREIVAEVHSRPDLIT